MLVKYKYNNFLKCHVAPERKIANHFQKESVPLPFERLERAAVGRDVCKSSARLENAIQIST